MKDLKNQDLKILVVDRIVENKLVCQELETEKIFNFNLSSDSREYNEGDVLIYGGGALKFDQELTEKRKKEMQSLFDDLFKN